jgi:hypothetical protein
MRLVESCTANPPVPLLTTDAARVWQAPTRWRTEPEVERS